jgi:hypothetical protein
MNTPEPLPEKFAIFADFGTGYVWVKSAGVTLEEYFPDNAAILQIEKELIEWCDQFDRSAWYHDPKFPWEEFHEKGLSLARRLADELKDTDIGVVYERPFEDPAFEVSKPIVIK